MQKEDFFLKQIDEFKEKAKYLHNLMMTKESKVEELEGQLEEKEEKAKNLQEILDGKQEEADKLTQNVRVQIDALISRVDAQMRTIDESISGEINTLEEQISEQLAEINSNSRQGLAEVNSNSRQGLAEMDKKIQDFSVSTSEKLEQQTNSMKETLESFSADLTKIKAELEKLAEAPKDDEEGAQKLEEVKLELGEKIHRENVKCYRNIQTLLEELEGKIERVEIGTQSMKVVKSYFGALIILGVVNFAGIIAIIAHMFGFF